MSISPPSAAPFLPLRDLPCFHRLAGGSIASTLAILVALALGGCGRVADADADEHATCDATCDGARACVRGVCIDTCGVDATSLDADIAPGLTPVVHVCGALPPGPIAARALSSGHEDAPFTLVVAHAREVGSAAVVAVDRFAASRGGGFTKARATCETTFRPSAPGAKITLSSHLGLSPAGAYPHFGLEASGGANGGGSEAVAFVLAEEGCAFFEHRMARYGGATMLSEDPRQLVVQGARDDGDLGGLYRGGVQLVGASLTGSVARLDDGRVVTPTGAGHGAVGLALYAEHALARGPFPARADASTFGALPRDFVVASGRGLVGRLAYEGPADAHSLFAIATDGAELEAAEPTFFAAARFEQIAPIEGSQRVALKHARGVLVVE